MAVPSDRSVLRPPSEAEVDQLRAQLDDREVARAMTALARLLRLLAQREQESAARG